MWRDWVPGRGTWGQGQEDWAFPQHSHPPNSPAQGPQCSQQLHRGWLGGHSPSCELHRVPLCGEAPGERSSFHPGFLNISP